MRARLALCMTTAWLAIACTSGDDTPPLPADKTSRSVGPLGATIELQDGAKVEIPEGALEADVVIKVSRVDAPRDLPFNLEAAGKAYAFEPHGTLFTKPVKVSVPFSGDETMVRPVKAQDEDDDNWRTVVGASKFAGKLELLTTSFSIYRAARPARGSGVITLPDGAVIDGSEADSGMFDSGTLDSGDSDRPDASISDAQLPDASEGGVSRDDDAGDAGDFEVTFVDPDLEASVRAHLSLPNGPLMASDLAELRFLGAFAGPIDSLEGIEHCTHLEQLAIGDGTLSDLSPLSHLTTLVRLTLPFSNTVNLDLADLSLLTNLQYLSASGPGIRGNLATLSLLSRLQEIDVSYSPVTGSVRWLRDLRALTHVNVMYSQVVGDLSSFSTLTNLTELKIESVPLSGDLAALSFLTNLQVLRAGGNILGQTTHGHVGSVSTLHMLRELHLRGPNYLGDIAELAPLTNLAILYIDNSLVSGDIAVFANMPHLTNVFLSDTEVTGDVAVFANTPELIEIFARRVALTGNLSAFSNATDLGWLALGSTAVGGDVASLSNLTSMRLLELDQNINITGDLSALSALTNVQDFYLRGSPGVTGNVSALSGLTTARTIDVSNTSISGSFGAFDDLHALNDLVVSSTFIDMDLSPLVANLGTHRISNIYANNNSIDCTAQASNIQALSNAGTNLVVTCP